MNTPATITAAQFAGLARDHLQGELEAARAHRAPDPVLPTGGEVEATLDPALAEGILAFISAAEAPSSEDDDDTAAQVAPAGRERGPIHLPQELAAPLLAAVRSAPPPERPMRSSALAASLHRSQAALGRAMMAKRALVTNDRALSRGMVDTVAASAGLEITPQIRPILERVGLRVLEDVFREEAARETGHYGTGPEQDRSLAAVHLHTSPSAGQASASMGLGAPDPLPLVTAALGPEAAPTPPDRPSPVTATATTVAPTESLASLTEAFFAKRVREKIRHQGIAQERTTLRLFFDILGDRPARDYRRQDITTFLDTLRRLPSSYGKSPKDKQLSVEELIARAEATGAPRLAD